MPSFEAALLGFAMRKENTMTARDWVLSIDQQVQRMSQIQAAREIQLTINTLEKRQIRIYDELAKSKTKDELADLGVHRYDDYPAIVWLDEQGNLVSGRESAGF